MKNLVILIIPLLLLIPAVSALGCESSNEKTYSNERINIEVIKMLPEDTQNFYYVDVQQLRDDDDLQYLYDQFQEQPLEYGLVKDITCVKIINVGWVASGYGHDWYVEIWAGEFNLSDMRVELQNMDWHENEFAGIELWELSNHYTHAIAIMDGRLIGGNIYGVKECIYSIKGSNRSLYDNAEVRDMLGRIHSGISFGIVKNWEINGVEAFMGSSYGKASKDTIWSHMTVGFEDEEEAEDALDDMNELLKEISGYQPELINYEIYRSGRFIEVDIEQPINDTSSGGPAGDYETDLEVIQLATSTFYSDVHGGWDSDAVGGTRWGCSDPEAADDPGHYYPTELATVGSHILTLSTTIFDPDNPENPRIEGTSGAATHSEIARHAIWMGLLVNASGEYESAAGTTDRGYVSPVTGATSKYLQDFPESAMFGNDRNGAPTPGGSYCWVVGKYGAVYGVYNGPDGHWYSGFNGVYP